MIFETEEERAEFRRMITNPDPEALHRRDELFAWLDANPAVFHIDGSVEFPYELNNP